MKFWGIFVLEIDFYFDNVKLMFVVGLFIYHFKSMPTSSYSSISKIMELIMGINPKSVLDVGVGFGKYGFLCREYLELWDGRADYKNFTHKIDGIEIFPDYITPVHDFIYNHIFLGDAFEILNQEDLRYDLVLLIDVLEHFNKEQGRELLKKILRNNKGVLISIPRYVSEQKEVFNNIYETHRASWTKSELRQFGKCYFKYHQTSILVYIGSTEIISEIKNKHSLKDKIIDFLSLMPWFLRFLRQVKRRFE